MSDRLEQQQVAVRYARALLDAALDLGPSGAALDTVLADLVLVQELLGSVPELTPYLEHPALPQAEKLETVTSMLNDRVHPLVANLVTVMVDNHRFGAFQAVVEQFRQLRNAFLQEVTVQVTTASPLPPDLSERLANRIAEVFGFKRVMLQPSVDPSLLGGVVLNFMDRLMDGSLNTKLQQLVAKV